MPLSVRSLLYRDAHIDIKVDVSRKRTPRATINRYLKTRQHVIRPTFDFTAVSEENVVYFDFVATQNSVLYVQRIMALTSLVYSHSIVFLAMTSSPELPS